MGDHSQNRTHAILDEQSRYLKAIKIHRLSRLSDIRPGMKMLEVGSGSGYICKYFSEIGFGFEGTFAVDVADERQVESGYQFSLVHDALLPFPDREFDFIISNHVIEHVGPERNQMVHLSEIKRCLKDTGILYLAFPNKWRLVEPHYRVPFLSWLPRGIAHVILRALGAAPIYDCYPMAAGMARRLLDQSGLTQNDKTIEAITVVADVEFSSRYIRFLLKNLAPLWGILKPIMPTLIFVAEKKDK
ncbi:class I SAM-dependent methyltransferase [Mesorhizobium sp. LjNodule214]|uniref:class I SAM-dependent methyltransferase n=1 Tax=Mesorhizobium sp. LjNodule214 TaxID=3342252 RepID=UPI003ECDCDEE